MCPIVYNIYIGYRTQKEDDSVDTVGYESLPVRPSPQSNQQLLQVCSLADKGRTGFFIQ